jgi:hypothetical protein
MQARAHQRAASQPIIDIEPRNGEMFGAAIRDIELSRSSVSEDTGRFEVIQERMDRFRELTGRALQNPEGNFPGDRNQQRAFVIEQFEQLRKERPDVELAYPTEEKLSEIVEVRAREALRDRQILEGRNVDKWTPWWTGVAGDFVGFIKDPVNQLATLPGVFMGSFSVLGAALTEAGLAAFSESAVQATNFDFRKRVDQSFGVTDALVETGQATAFGFALGGTLRGLANAWHLASPAVKSRIPRHVKDAANVVTREATTGRIPFAPTPRNEGVHRRSVQKAAEDLTENRPVTLPPEAFVAGRQNVSRVYDAEGRDVGVSYEVVEASSLITSHGPDLRPNPEFPVDTLQPRFRDRPISQDQIHAISARLQPERLGPNVQADGGAPIVAGDNLVESGNARVLALKRVYERGGVNAENYRNFLRSIGHSIDDFDEPVLVARRITPLDPEERIRFVNAANRATAMRLSATEQALADSRFLDEALVDAVDGSDLRTARNRNFVRGFLSKLPRSEQGSLLDGRGALSQDGERRLLAALMARAYGDPAILSRALEDSNSNIRAIAGALADVAGEWTRLREAVQRGDIPRGMDITDDVLQAVRSVMRARDAGRPLHEFLEQAEMFGGPGEIAKMIGAFMFRDADLKRPISRGALAKMLRDFATEAQKNLQGARLLGDTLSEEDILNTTLRNADREDLINRVDDFSDPEVVEDIARAPETEDQVLRELDVLRAETDIQVPVTREDPDGNKIVETRSLDDLLDEADEEIAAGNQIELCLTGGPAA